MNHIYIFLKHELGPLSLWSKSVLEQMQCHFTFFFLTPLSIHLNLQQHLHTRHWLSALSRIITKEAMKSLQIKHFISLSSNALLNAFSMAGWNKVRASWHQTRISKMIPVLTQNQGFLGIANLPAVVVSQLHTQIYSQPEFWVSNCDSTYSWAENKYYYYKIF